MSAEVIPTARPLGRIATLLVAFLIGMAARSCVGRAPTAADDHAALPQSASSAPTSGPREFDDGIPSGFARTSDGARAAAAHYVLTGQALLAMVPTEVSTALDQMAASGSADSQVTEAQEQLRQLRDRLATGTGPIRYLQSVLATRVEAFTPERARVSVWSVGVLSRIGAAHPQAGWTTSTLELVWERDDWRIWDNTITPGPTPALNASAPPSSAEQLDQALVGFTAWTGAS